MHFHYFSELVLLLGLEPNEAHKAHKAQGDQQLDDGSCGDAGDALRLAGVGQGGGRRRGVRRQREDGQCLTTHGGQESNQYFELRSAWGTGR